MFETNEFDRIVHDVHKNDNSNKTSVDIFVEHLKAERDYNLRVGGEIFDKYSSKMINKIKEAWRNRKLESDKKKIIEEQKKNQNLNNKKSFVSQEKQRIQKRKAISGIGI